MSNIEISEKQHGFDFRRKHVEVGEASTTFIDHIPFIMMLRKERNAQKHCQHNFDYEVEVSIEAPYDTAYIRGAVTANSSCCANCVEPPRTLQWRPDLPFLGHAGHADPLYGWRCCSQKRVMSRPIQLRQL